MTLRHGDRPGDADEGVGLLRHVNEYPVFHLRPSTFGPVTLSEFLREEIEKARIETAADKSKGKQKDIDHNISDRCRVSTTRTSRAKDSKNNSVDRKIDNPSSLPQMIEQRHHLDKRTTLLSRSLGSEKPQHSEKESLSNGLEWRSGTAQHRVTLSASPNAHDGSNVHSRTNRMEHERATDFSEHAKSKRMMTREFEKPPISQPSIISTSSGEESSNNRPRKTSVGINGRVFVHDSKRTNRGSNRPSLSDSEEHKSIFIGRNMEQEAGYRSERSEAPHLLLDLSDLETDQNHNLENSCSEGQLNQGPEFVRKQTSRQKPSGLQNHNRSTSNDDCGTLDCSENESGMDSCSSDDYFGPSAIPVSVPYPFKYESIVPGNSSMLIYRGMSKSDINRNNRILTNAQTVPISKWLLRPSSRDSVTSAEASEIANLPLLRPDRSRGPRSSVSCPDQKWRTKSPPRSSNAPPICLGAKQQAPRNSGQSHQFHNTDESCLPGFNNDVWLLVASFLSAEDVRRLRFVSKGFATALEPIVMRNIVTKFGKSLFNLNTYDQDDVNLSTPTKSMLAKFGKNINKFGISFEYDFEGLANVRPKIVNKEEQAWFGNFVWPLEKYPRYTALQALEDLMDNNRSLLKDELAYLDGVTELGLSVDSGHGWLEGPDISDLALYDIRCTGGHKVFGKTFRVDDVWHTFGRDEYFQWAQQNSIDESIKELARRMDSLKNKQKIQEFESIIVRPYHSFENEEAQFDYDALSHIGDQPPQTHTGQPPPMPPQPPILGHNQTHIGQFNPQSATTTAVATRDIMIRRRRLAASKRQSKKDPIQPQYPLIFNSHNVSAAVGGNLHWAAAKADNPIKFPFLPGSLTEAQVEWLMETVWAQRAFLSSYTTAVITNKRRLETVHTLNVSPLSSGLLPCLEQHEFWSCLPKLKKLKILISPDWRKEHVSGDSFYATNMRISPITASVKFSQFLKRYIARLEGLSHLSIGYRGGGEHAVGMYARNQHVLPAPVTQVPRTWITDHLVTKPDPSTLVKFDHIRELTFENCWFSPCMLQAFMVKSRDTSLRTLTLESVSMLPKNDTNTDGPLMTARNTLKCKHSPENYLLEAIPNSAAWTSVLDKITPGPTLLDRKYASGLIDPTMTPRPEREFRGNVRKIVLNSCGYVKISGVKGDELNQNALVVHSANPMDLGLVNRKARFERGCSEPPISIEDDDPPLGPMPTNAYLFGPNGASITNTTANPEFSASGTRTIASTINKSIMMSTLDPATNSDWFGLGTLTQCIHPIEKRLLECAWGMRFGWGDTMERWKSVEDGFFEGGTGRFSGSVGVEEA